MEHKQTTKCLPEELVENIVARMEFPYIFKAKSLSKSWLARFLPAQCHIEKSKKLLAARFQQQVTEWSNRWDIFHPFQSSKSKSEAYGWTCQKWRRIPSIQFLPLIPELWSGLRSNDTIVRHMGGTLLLLSFEMKLIVANVLTRSWKELPPGPQSDNGWTLLLNACIVPQASTQTYEIFSCCGQLRSGKWEDWVLCIYDSKKNRWSTKAVRKEGLPVSNLVYLNGVLYMIEDRNQPLAMNLEKGTFQELHLPEGFNIDRDHDVCLVVCGGNLFFIVSPMFSSSLPMEFKVLKQDETSGRFSMITSATLKGGQVYDSSPIGHGDCIIFGVKEATGKTLRYNVEKHEWSWYPSHCHPRSTYFDCSD